MIPGLFAAAVVAGVVWLGLAGAVLAGWDRHGRRLVSAAYVAGVVAAALVLTLGAVTVAAALGIHTEVLSG